MNFAFYRLPGSFYIELSLTQLTRTDKSIKKTFKVFQATLKVQSSIVRAQTGCEESLFKDWVRRGIVQPACKKSGSGNHAEYDEASLVCTAVALQLNSFHVKLFKYVLAFHELHSWLRSNTVLRWTEVTLLVQPNRVIFFDRPLSIVTTESGFHLDLNKIVQALLPQSPQHQIAIAFSTAPSKSTCMT